MVRFFALDPIPAPDREALRALAVAFSAQENVVAIQRWVVRSADVPRFLSVALMRGVRVFHDALFQPPDANPRCEGSQVFGNALQKRLRTDHAIDGSSALIVIADGGVYSKELTQALGVIFDPRIAGPASGSTAPRTHGTMCALDAYMGAPKARFGDLHVANGEAAVASDLFLGFTQLLKLQGDSMASYKACVVSLSMHVPIESATTDMLLPEAVRLTFNALHPLWAKTAELGAAGFDVIVAAGNDGCAQAPIKGLALHPSVLTIGAVDGNRLIEPRSSRGLGDQKPDFSAYTNFLWSQVFGPGSYDSGTSAATALAAGLLASLRTSRPEAYRQTLPPNKLRDYLRPLVGRAVGNGVTLTGHSHEYGWGIV